MLDWEKIKEVWCSSLEFNFPVLNAKSISSQKIFMTSIWHSPSQIAELSYYSRKCQLFISIVEKMEYLLENLFELLFAFENLWLTTIKPDSSKSSTTVSRFLVWKAFPWFIKNSCVASSFSFLGLVSCIRRFAEIKNKLFQNKIGF